MNAQEILDSCDMFIFSRKKFRNEMNFAGLINDTIKEFERQNGRE